MTEKGFGALIDGKEVHFRLLTNDLLENGKPSMTVIGRGSCDDAILKDGVFAKQEYTQYNPQSILGKLMVRVSGRSLSAKEYPGVFVVVEEKHGLLSADDARYIEWLGSEKGELPRVVMVPEPGHGHKHEAEASQPHHLLDEKEAKRVHSFWARQWRRVRAMPAPITKDAALAAIPRTIIPVGFSIFLAFLKRNEVPLERATGYIGLAFGFAVGFALFNQTVLNFITFWSEFTKDACEPYIKALSGWAAKQLAIARYFVNFLGFISARGDVLIAGPLLGIGCTYLARLVLGPVGQTDSVLTLYGFFLVLCNVIIGSIAGGPYPQVIAHLRAVGKISNRASMYLGIVDTVKMELGRVADFGMQTLYNSIQVTLAAVFWLLLLLVDRCFLKPDVHRLERREDIELARRLFKQLRAREDVKQALAESAN